MSYWPKNNYPFPPPVAFIHIPKTAGISIQEWYRKTYGKFYKCMHAPVTHPAVSMVLEEMPAFCVVRNPFDLVYSWYRYKRQMLAEKRHRDPVELQAWRAGFDFWLPRYIDKINYTTDKTRPGEFNTITPARPQLDYITQQGQIKTRWILRFESLSKDIEQVNDYTGCHVLLTHENKSDLQIKDYRNAYTKRTRKLVEKYYERDLNYFNYDF